MKKFFAPVIMMLAIASPTLANVNINVAGPIQQAIGIIIGTIVIAIFIILAVGSFIVKRNDKGKIEKQ
jgi:hypothetical protein